MIYASRSEQGVRNQNQDHIFLPQKEKYAFVIVADGMGGHNAGLTASTLAVQTAAEVLKTGGFAAPLLKKAIAAANTAVFEHAREDQSCYGMGTTMVAAVLHRKWFMVANVGDSRLYLFEQGALTQITRDHSLVAELVEAGQITMEEARVHPRRNIITRAVGTRENEKADVFQQSWSRGDILMLCSDGLYDAVTDAQMTELLKRTGSLNEICDALVEAAITGGSTDNISVVLVKNEEAR